MKKVFNFLFIAICCMFVTLDVAAKTKKKKETVTYKVNMTCSICQNKIEKNIPFEKGIKELVVDLNTDEVKVVFDPRKNSAKSIKEALEELDFEVSIIADKKVTK